MDYQDIIHIIEGKRRFGNLPGVEASRKLLAAVGNPQKGLVFIHIAGTNGKGSTAAFLHEILKQSGIKTGLFTSPHLIEFEERIRINGEKIPKWETARLGQFLLDTDAGIQPTMFDYSLAMALLYFKEQGCQIAVLETGLGGRLDGTNAVGVPVVSIITKIGYDHTAVLGDTLVQIAAEKAGILKEGTKAVFEGQEEEVMAVLKQRCYSLHIPFCVVDKAKVIPAESGFIYAGERYHMKMHGSFQRENAMAAVLAARELMALGYPVTEEALHRGIAGMAWEGRMEIMFENPYLMIDGAHNEDGVAALVTSLCEQFPGEKFHFIMGVLADKDYRKMVGQVLPLAVKVTAVTQKNGRALAGEELAAYISACGVPSESCTNVQEALKPFLNVGNRIGIRVRTIAFGSLYFIGEIRKCMSKAGVITASF
ncbi:MAG: bifunctional folylpolyglutamate synthase/dihydrofolate synthase [Eubacterium sp.]|jgi:dihydrofolate synthase/folylpolyglutamate synthase|nr:bifunctional folylpolyglutamate synthase/dihydrofolate synthase [Eubacterium sp.]NBI87803.1 bifunctional folylpolyglutamate synthase/dihydrofolate synthase [Lachnospiraceae bacterium]